MKKLCFVALVAIFSFGSIYAQGGFSGGLHLGIPSGDVSDFTSLNVGVDVTYLFEVSDGFEAGITSGYTHFIGKDTTIDFGGEGSFTSQVEDFGFIPLAGTARYGFSDQIFGAVDLGYGISTNGGTGGFYYQPKVGYNGETIDFFGFYKGISRDGSTVGSFGVGAAYKFN